MCGVGVGDLPEWEGFHHTPILYVNSSPISKSFQKLQLN